MQPWLVVMMPQKFSISATDPPETVPLKPGGDEIVLTHETLNEYIRLVLNFRCGGEFKDQLKAFVKGFPSMIPMKEISMFRPDELCQLISGVPGINPDEFEKHVEYKGYYSRGHPVIQRFFEVFRDFTDQDKGELLAFVTGACKVPAEGFEFYAKSGQPFTILPYATTAHFPVSHLCVNSLSLPEYVLQLHMSN
jgi:E3 ubiquitin-protein ligase NEDD4